MGQGVYVRPDSYLVPSSVAAGVATGGASPLKRKDGSSGISQALGKASGASASTGMSRRLHQAELLRPLLDKV